MGPASKARAPGAKTQHFVILSGAKNLSFFSIADTEERFFAPLRMTKWAAFPVA
jgi:hypothetical protein